MGKILDLQTRVKAILEADAAFAGVDILTESKGDLESELTRALERLGFGVVVTSSEGQNKDPRQRAPFFDETLTVALFLVPTLDGGQHNMPDAVEAAILALHHSPVGTGPTAALSPRRFEVVRHYDVESPKGSVGHHLEIRTICAF